MGRLFAFLRPQSKPLSDSNPPDGPLGAEAPTCSSAAGNHFEADMWWLLTFLAVVGTLAFLAYMADRVGKATQNDG
jgi:hypothetical protein